ncbi:hypothetical protein [Streptomyces sp. NPDC093600]|uniref:hypothetical protein n=1 Tax=Streptomyces sp. NPDC093600 TaxID=3366047 RepID=UPI0037FC5ACB
MIGVLIGLAGKGEDENPPPPATTAAPTAPGQSRIPERSPERAPTPGDTSTASGGEIPGEGTFLVGEEIEPGTYRSAGGADESFPSCYWARLRGTTGNPDEVIANHASKGQTTVTILASDRAFLTQGCKPWSKIG